MTDLLIDQNTSHFSVRLLEIDRQERKCTSCDNTTTDRYEQRKAPMLHANSNETDESTADKVHDGSQISYIVRLWRAWLQVSKYASFDLARVNAEAVPKWLLWNVRKTNQPLNPPTPQMHHKLSMEKKDIYEKGRLLWKRKPREILNFTRRASYLGLTVDTLIPLDAHTTRDLVCIRLIIRRRGERWDFSLERNNSRTNRGDL